MSRILIVEDDLELSAMLKRYLEGESFAVDAVHDGSAGVECALSGRYDVVVLDVMLPQRNGIEALRAIRAQSDVPVLMLTARGDDVDKIVGLELGADDYVPKPCTPRELAARVRAILRRTERRASNDGGATLTLGALSLSPQKRRADYGGHEIDLTSTEFNVLEALARNAGAIVSKQELSEEALGRPLARFDRSIDVHVSRIRFKLKHATAEAIQIKTIHRMGYQLVHA